MKYETVQDIRDLQPGDTVRSKYNAITYLVINNYGTHVTAIRVADVTNAIEWEVLVKDVETKEGAEE